VGSERSKDGDDVMRVVLRGGEILACCTFVFASTVMLGGSDAGSIRGEEGLVLLLLLIVLWIVAVVSSLVRPDLAFRSVSYGCATAIGSILFRRAAIASFQDPTTPAPIWSGDFLLRFGFVVIATLLVVVASHGLAVALRKWVGAMRGAT